MGAQVASTVGQPADSAPLQPAPFSATGHPGYEHAAGLGIVAAQSASFSCLPGFAGTGDSPAAASALPPPPPPAADSWDPSEARTSISMQEANLLLESMKVWPCVPAHNVDRAWFRMPWGLGNLHIPPCTPLPAMQDRLDVQGGLEVLSNMKAAGIQPDQVRVGAICAQLLHGLCSTLDAVRFEQHQVRIQLCPCIPACRPATHT